LSGLPPKQLREKVRTVLETMHGSYNVWSLDITEVRKSDSNFVVVGNFREGFLGPTVSYEITMDENGNVIEAKIG